MYSPRIPTNIFVQRKGSTREHKVVFPSRHHEVSNILIREITKSPVKSCISNKIMLFSQLHTSQEIENFGKVYSNRDTTVYRGLVGKTERKEPLARPRLTSWEDNIKMYPIETSSFENVGWINFVQNIKPLRRSFHKKMVVS
jgi:hypothetical protein